MNLYDERKDRQAIHDMIIAKVAELTGESKELIETVVLQEQLAINEILEEKLDLELTGFGAFVIKGRLAVVGEKERRIQFLNRKKREARK